MLIDDKKEHHNPPDYTTQDGHTTLASGSGTPGPSYVIPPLNLGENAPPRLVHNRTRSVLYESDMEDPFSNPGGGPSSSTGLGRRESVGTGFFGNGTNVLPAPGTTGYGYMSNSTSSGPPSTTVGDRGAEDRFRPLSTISDGSALYNDVDASHRMYGQSLKGDARGTYYDSEADQSIRTSPSAEVGDESPLVKSGLGASTKSFPEPDATGRGLQPLDYQDPYGFSSYSEGPSPPAVPEKKAGFFNKVFGDPGLRNPIEQRIENRNRGVMKQRRPWLCYILAVVMTGVLIYELVYNQKKQGSPISLKPYVNPMLGPSQVGLVSLGARWPACMRDVSEIPLTLELGCPSNKANPATKLCTIEQLCSFGGFHNKKPNQWWRFITPVFLHAGIVHLLFNMIAQLTVSAQVERQIGSIAFFVLYFAAGIFGNVLGGNFALVGLPSVGASGAIFGTVGVQWVDLLAHWGLEQRPGRKLLMLSIDLLVGIALGFIPGVDNFVHLGGFLLGLICAAIFLPVISTTKRHKMIMWGIRIAMIPLAVVLFVVLIRNFYTSDPSSACEWCRYISCIPTSANNHCKGSGLTITTTST